MHQNLNPLLSGKTAKVCNYMSVRLRETSLPHHPHISSNKAGIAFSILIQKNTN
jgi:hypothetical protein